jgi:hypothetical protein
MARKQDLPGFYEKRKLLFSEKARPEDLREAGRQFMEAERYDDALEFFERCDADDLARQIAERAMERGNTPLYMRAKRVLGEEISDGEWRGLAQSAERAGRLSMAYVARQKAGDEEEAARLKVQLAEAAPQGGEQPAAAAEHE